MSNKYRKRFEKISEQLRRNMDLKAIRGYMEEARKIREGTPDGYHIKSKGDKRAKTGATTQTDNKQNTNSGTISIQIDMPITKVPPEQEKAHGGDQTSFSNVSCNINDGIQIQGNGNIGSINIGEDGYIHYKDRRISAKDFQAWRKLERNSRTSSMNIQEILEAYLKEAEDFESFVNSPTNEGKDKKSLWREFQDKLNSEYEQAKTEQKAEDRKREKLNSGNGQKKESRRKDKFGYYVDKGEEDIKREEMEKNNSVTINGQEYKGPVTIKGKGMVIHGVKGGTKIDIGSKYAGGFNIEVDSR